MTKSESMRQFTSHDDFDEWVEDIAINGLRMGASPRRVAEVVITDIEVVGDEVTLLTNGEPFTPYRVEPATVITWYTLGDYDDKQPSDGFRETAVDYLVRALQQKVAELEDDYQSNGTQQTKN